MMRGPWVCLAKASWPPYARHHGNWVLPCEFQGLVTVKSKEVQMKTSAIVVSWNREDLIEACLASLGFADEIILVDKSSTDKTVQRAAKWADRIETVPWSPVPGETYAYALSLCKHDWIAALSDDECFNTAAIDFFKEEILNPRADIYYIPRQDYILGRHDPNAYYWPEWHPQYFRRGSLHYEETIHGSARLLSKSQYIVPAETGIAIVHLSHEDTAQWIDKANRYTSQPDRLHTWSNPNNRLSKFVSPESNLTAFAHGIIDFWASKTNGTLGNGYPIRVALLRAVYDLIDRVKELEEIDEIDGRELFRVKSAELLAEYERYFGRSSRNEGHKAKPHSSLAGRPADEKQSSSDKSLDGGQVDELRTEVAKLKRSVAARQARVNALVAECEELTQRFTKQCLDIEAQRVADYERMTKQILAIEELRTIEHDRLTKQALSLEALRAAEFERAERAEQQLAQRADS